MEETIGGDDEAPRGDLTVQLQVELAKMVAEIGRISAETSRINKETRMWPWVPFAIALLSNAGLIGGAVALVLALRR